ncbi:MAG TPA: hypothetical protein VKV80_14540 [Streptosporangiaceae bacterium]|nr:hypothetical protein [Streptosporangiaceae bacterium]
MAGSLLPRSWSGKWRDSCCQPGAPGRTIRPVPYSRRIFGHRPEEQNMIAVRPFWRRWAMVSAPLPVRSR